MTPPIEHPVQDSLASYVIAWPYTSYDTDVDTCRSGLYRGLTGLYGAAALVAGVYSLRLFVEMGQINPGAR